MKMIKLAMLGATALAIASLAPVMAAENGCAKFKTDFAGTPTTFPVPTPMTSFEPSFDMLMPSETAAAFYTGDNVPIVKKLKDNGGMTAWKPEEALIDDGKFDGRVSQSFVLASADILLQDGAIKVNGVITADEALIF